MRGKAGPRPVDTDEARRNAKAAHEAFATGRIECLLETYTPSLASEGKKVVALRFSVVLDAAIAERMTAPVLKNFNHLRKADSQAGVVDIEAGAVPAQNWKFFDLPERGRHARWTLDAIAPEKLELKKVPKAGTVQMLFTLKCEATEDVFDLMKQWGNTLYFDFEEAQMTLDEAAGKAKAAGAED